MSTDKLSEIFRTNLSYYLRLRKKTQKELAEYIGVSAVTVNYYIKGGNLPRFEKIDKICEFLKITRAELLGDRFSDSKQQAPTYDLNNKIEIIPTKKIPLLGSICAGNGIYMEENLEKYLAIDSSTIDADYCLRVKGNSMIDANIFENDIVFFEKNFYFENGGIYAVVVKGEEIGSIKKVHKKGNMFILEACNKDYNLEFHEIENVEICGKYKGLLRSE